MNHGATKWQDFCQPSKLEEFWSIGNSLSILTYFHTHACMYICIMHHACPFYSPEFIISRRVPRRTYMYHVELAYTCLLERVPRSREDRKKNCSVLKKNFNFKGVHLLSLELFTVNPQNAKPNATELC